MKYAKNKYFSSILIQIKLGMSPVLLYLPIYYIPPGTVINNGEWILL